MPSRFDNVRSSHRSNAAAICLLLSGASINTEISSDLACKGYDEAKTATGDSART